MPIRLAAALGAFACLLPCAALATDDGASPLTITLTRYARALDDAPAHVTVLDADDLAPLAHLPAEDILARHAGVTLARTGGPGQQASLFLRGTNSDSTLVLVDGVKLNGGAFGGASLQHLRGADIARIEVIRGPRSTLYGSEAIGGVIAITTRRAAGTAQRVRAGAGSDQARELRVEASRAHDAWQAAAGFGWLRTDGDPVTDRTGITGEHANRSGTLNASRALGEHRVGVDLWAASGRTRYVDCVYDAFFNCTGITPLEQDFDNATASLWGEFRAGEHTLVRARLGHAGDRVEQLQSTDIARTRRLVAGVDARHVAGAHTIIAGIDTEREEVNAVIYGGEVRAENDIASAFVREEWSAGAHTLSAALRATHYDTFGSHHTGEASWGWRIATDTYGWVAWGRGFRAPDATERFGFGGNPDLDPERSDSLEAGLRQRLGRHQWTLVGFRQDIDDLVDYPAPTFTATNIARARITGTELGWSWQAGPTRLEALATLMDPVDAATGQRLSRRPEQQLSTSLHHVTGPLAWRASVLAMDARDNSAFDAVRLTGYAVVDLGVTWTATPALAVDLRIDNAGDRAYALASGAAGDYRMPDRALFLAIDWQP